MAERAGDEIADRERQVIALLRGHHQLVAGAIAAGLYLNVGQRPALHRDMAGDIGNLDAVHIFVPSLIFVKPSRDVIADQDADAR